MLQRTNGRFLDRTVHGVLYLGASTGLLGLSGTHWSRAIVITIEVDVIARGSAPAT